LGFLGIVYLLTLVIDYTYKGPPLTQEQDTWQYPWRYSEGQRNYDDLSSLYDCPRKITCVDRLSALAGVTESEYRYLTQFLSEIQVRYDGRFVCIRPDCKLQSFEVSLEALEHHFRGHYDETICNYVFWECKRKVMNQQLQQAFMTRKTWDLCTVKEQRYQLVLDTQRFKQKASGCYKVISQTRQFQDLKALKKAFRTKYTDFLRASDSSPELPEFADMLRSTYRNSRGLHRLGFGVFRKVLAGTAPTTVLEVFAFELLSGAMTNVMRNVWNKGISHEPQDIDYLIWRNAIQDNGDKDLFDHLMNNWFPHSLLLQVDTSSVVPPSHEAMRDYIFDLVFSRRATEPLNFSAFSSPEITNHTYDTRFGTHGMHCGSFDSLWGIKSPPWPGGILQVGSNPMTIRDSVVFMGAYLFMICEWHEFSSRLSRHCPSPFSPLNLRTDVH
jgi:hypothetical protein